MTERPIRSATDSEEVILRAKRFVYEEESELTSLRSYVSNVEAAIEYQRAGPKRDPPATGSPLPAGGVTISFAAMRT
jgi:hypothetical protein